jgi:hypothetical protein
MWREDGLAYPDLQDSGGVRTKTAGKPMSIRVRPERLWIVRSDMNYLWLAGFYLVEARDLDHAIQVAAGIPAAREGSVEIRPVRQLNP